MQRRSLFLGNICQVLGMAPFHMPSYSQTSPDPTTELCLPQINPRDFSQPSSESDEYCWFSDSLKPEFTSIWKNFTSIWREAHMQGGQRSRHGDASWLCVHQGDPSTSCWLSSGQWPPHVLTGVHGKGKTEEGATMILRSGLRVPCQMRVYATAACNSGSFCKVEFRQGKPIS